MKIPLNDLKAQHDPIIGEINAAIEKVISKSEFIGGEELDNFEKNFADYCGKKFCIGASSGSTALYLALKSLDVKKGDEVIIPVNTFAATAFAVTLLGAMPVFADVNVDDFLINIDLIERLISKRTKAIIPVHLYGGVCDMDKIIEIAGRHKIKIIEDCAQAHGSVYKGQKVPISEIGCFSFFPTKSLGAMGDAGCVVSSNEEFAKKCKMIANQGRTDKYYHTIEGFNFRLDNLQTAVLNIKLKHLDSWLGKKRELASVYGRELKEIVGKQELNEEIVPSYYVYVIKTKNRDDLKKHLEAAGISSGVHYPIPLHLQPAFSYLGHKEGDFPVAERISKEILSIPMYAELGEELQSKVIEEIKNFYFKE